MNEFGFNQKVDVTIERQSFTGYFDIEIWRGGKLFHTERAKNGVVNIGKDSILDWAFRNQTQPTTWYLGLMNTGATEAAADTMSSHAGWTEVTAYTEGTRPAWTTVAAASQSITNTTSTDFSINGSATLYGIFATSDNTKSGTTGTLWATAAFASEIPVVNTDILKITYTVNAT
jgi:hypothetical protein